MKTTTQKGISYIYYGKNDGTMVYGSFDEVPMDAYIGIINLKIPYIDEIGELKYKEYMHRIYCGDDLPAQSFLDVYGKSISVQKLEMVKRKINEGYNTIIIPFGKSTEFSFLTKEDQLCRSRAEFEDLISAFKEKNIDILDFINPFDEEKHQNKI